MRIIKPVGVIIAKKIIPITIGATIFPNIKPNLNQILLGVCSRLAFVKLTISIITAIKNDHSLIDSPDIIGQKEMMKKIIEKIIPKFRSDPIFDSFIFIGLNITK